MKMRVLDVKSRRAIKQNLVDERGSISVLIIALFLLTVALIMTFTNVAAVTIAKRTLTQSAESTAQRGAHFLDEEAYYTGKFTVITMAMTLLGRGPADPGVPIDCVKARGGIQEALSDLDQERDLLGQKNLHNLQVVEINCDGRDLRVALSAVVDLPFVLPFLNIRTVNIESSATTFNQRNDGFYLFGHRIS